MGNISLHFNRAEFACRCGCGYDDISPALLDVLEAAREAFSAPIIINSGCRCPTYNKRVGGVTGSQHQLGLAADIVIKGSTPTQVYQWLVTRYAGALGIGLYATFVHVDVRSSHARWKG